MSKHIDVFSDDRLMEKADWLERALADILHFQLIYELKYKGAHKKYLPLPNNFAIVVKTEDKSHEYMRDILSDPIMKRTSERARNSSYNPEIKVHFVEI